MPTITKLASRQRMWLYLDPETQARLEEVARKARRRPHDQAAVLLTELLNDMAKGRTGRAS